MKHEQLLAAFTPSIMSHEALEAIFVRRESLATRLMDSLRTSAHTRSKRHLLLVGPRGIGKTHLVSLLYYRVKEDDGLRDSFRIAWLREEQWEVASFLDLLESILQALAAEYENEALAAAQMELRSLSVETAEVTAERLLLEFLGDHVLLLIVENLEDLFEALDEIGQRQFRAFLQNHANTVLLATTPSLYYGVSDHDAPFFGFFNVTHLDELTLDDAVLLLEKIAALREDPKLAAFIQTEAGHDRLAAVQHLAGGHPRIWIFFAGIVTEETLDALVPAFLEMLDDLTPYYQSRMKELSPQQRKIVSLLCTRRGAAPVKEIADACRLSQQVAGAQLHSLRERSIVRSEAAGRESWYELNEPLMRLVFEIKESRGRPIRLIVDFLRRWYSRSERRAKYATTPAEARMTRQYIEAALDLRGFSDAEPRARETSFKWSVPDELLDAEDFEKALDAIEETIEQAGRSVTAEHWFYHGRCLHGQERYVESLQSYDRAIDIDPKYARACIGRGNALNNIERYEEALESYERAIELDPKNARAYQNRGVSLYNCERYEEALDYFDRAIELDPENADFYNTRGVLLNDIKRYCEALKSYNQAVELDPRHAWAYNNRGVVFENLQCYEEALESYDRAIELNPKNATAHENRGDLLQSIERYEEALESYDRAIELDPKNAVFYIEHGILLYNIKRYEEALKSYDRAIELNPNNSYPRFNRGEPFLAQSRWAEFLGNLQQAFLCAEAMQDDWRGDTELYCRLILSDASVRGAWPERIAMLASLYDEHQALKQLAQGVTESLPVLFKPWVTDDVADAWNAAWQAAGKGQSDLEIPLRLLDTAVRWRRKPDRRILLRLPIEERRVLESLLPVKQ